MAAKRKKKGKAPSDPGESAPVPAENPAKADTDRATVPGVPPSLVAVVGDRPVPHGVDCKVWIGHLCLVDVYGWMAENRSRNVKAACEATGWPRDAYYVARSDPHVAALAHSTIVGIQAAAADQVTRRLPQVIANILEIAEGGEGVAAVRAAQWVTGFLEGHKGDLDKQSKEAKVDPGKSAAALAMERFPGGGRITQKTTTTKETTVTPDAIDVTPRPR